MEFITQRKRAMEQILPASNVEVLEAAAAKARRTNGCGPGILNLQPLLQQASTASVHAPGNFTVQSESWPALLGNLQAALAGSKPPAHGGPASTGTSAAAATIKSLAAASRALADDAAPVATRQPGQAAHRPAVVTRVTAPAPVVASADATAPLHAAVPKLRRGQHEQQQQEQPQQQQQLHQQQRQVEQHEQQQQERQQREREQQHMQREQQQLQQQQLRQLSALMLARQLQQRHTEMLRFQVANNSGPAPSGLACDTIGGSGGDCGGGGMVGPDGGLLLMQAALQGAAPARAEGGGGGSGGGSGGSCGGGGWDLRPGSTGSGAAAQDDPAAAADLVTDESEELRPEDTAASVAAFLLCMRHSLVHLYRLPAAAGNAAGVRAVAPRPQCLEAAAAAAAAPAVWAHSLSAQDVGGRGGGGAVALMQDAGAGPARAGPALAARQPAGGATAARAGRPAKRAREAQGPPLGRKFHGVRAAARDLRLGSWQDEEDSEDSPTPQRHTDQDHWVHGHHQYGAEAAWRSLDVNAEEDGTTESGAVEWRTNGMAAATGSSRLWPLDCAAGTSGAPPLLLSHAPASSTPKRDAASPAMDGLAPFAPLAALAAAKLAAAAASHANGLLASIPDAATQPDNRRAGAGAPRASAPLPRLEPAPLAHSQLLHLLPVSLDAANRGAGARAAAPPASAPPRAGSAPGPPWQPPARPPRHHRGPLLCSNCATTQTPLWRKDRVSGATVCNACGIYKQTHGCDRPADGRTLGPQPGARRGGGAAAPRAAAGAASREAPAAAAAAADCGAAVREAERGASSSGASGRSSGGHVPPGSLLWDAASHPPAAGAAGGREAERQGLAGAQYPAAGWSHGQGQDPAAATAAAAFAGASGGIGGRMAAGVHHSDGAASAAHAGAGPQPRLPARPPSLSDPAGAEQAAAGGTRQRQQQRAAPRRQADAHGAHAQRQQQQQHSDEDDGVYIVESDDGGSERRTGGVPAERGGAVVEAPRRGGRQSAGQAHLPGRRANGQQLGARDGSATRSPADPQLQRPQQGQQGQQPLGRVPQLQLQRLGKDDVVVVLARQDGERKVAGGGGKQGGAGGGAELPRQAPAAIPWDRMTAEQRRLLERGCAAEAAGGAEGGEWQEGPQACGPPPQQQTRRERGGARGEGGEGGEGGRAGPGSTARDRSAIGEQILQRLQQLKRQRQQEQEQEQQQEQQEYEEQQLRLDLGAASRAQGPHARGERGFGEPAAGPPPPPWLGALQGESGAAPSAAAVQSFLAAVLAQHLDQHPSPKQHDQHHQLRHEQAQGPGQAQRGGPLQLLQRGLAAGAGVVGGGGEDGAQAARRSVQVAVAGAAGGSGGGGGGGGYRAAAGSWMPL